MLALGLAATAAGTKAVIATQMAATTTAEAAALAEAAAVVVVAMVAINTIVTKVAATEGAVGTGDNLTEGTRTSWVVLLAALATTPWAEAAVVAAWEAPSKPEDPITCTAVRAVWKTKGSKAECAVAVVVEDVVASKVA